MIPDELRSFLINWFGAVAFSAWLLVKFVKSVGGEFLELRRWWQEARFTKRSQPLRRRRRRRVDGNNRCSAPANPPVKW